MEGTVAFKNKVGNILQTLEKWQKKWQIQLNLLKCKLFCISNKRSPPLTEIHILRT